MGHKKYKDVEVCSWHGWSLYISPPIIKDVRQNKMEMKRAKYVLLESGHDGNIIFRPVMNDWLIERRDTDRFYKL